MAKETYGEILSDLVDDMAKADERADIFRRNQISRNHFHNVTNPNRKSSSGDPYYCPTEWGVILTKDSKNYTWIKTVAKDCNCIIITPEEQKKLTEAKPEETIDLIQSIFGMIKNGK